MKAENSVLIPLHHIAHGRTGDKGNRLNVNVIAYAPEFWPVLLDELQPDDIAALFAHRGAVRVTRYELPNLHALNFVIDDVLEGGVNSSLSIDTHGKTLSYMVLGLMVAIPAHLANRALPSMASFDPTDIQSGRTS